MKHKYKLGQRLETNDHFGEVEVIRIDGTGVSYELAGADSAVREDEVQAVWKKAQPRKSREATTPARTRSKKNGRDTEARA